MIRGRYGQFIAALLVALMTFPVSGRTVIQCVDGTPCISVHPADAAHDCCHYPQPCRVPVKQRCVVTRIPADSRVRPDSDFPIHPPLSPAILSTVLVPPPPKAPVFAGAFDTAPDHPPDQPAPKQGRAPRSPPVVQPHAL